MKNCNVGEDVFPSSKGKKTKKKYENENDGFEWSSIKSSPNHLSENIYTYRERERES